MKGVDTWKKETVLKKVAAISLYLVSIEIRMHASNSDLTDYSFSNFRMLINA